MSISTEAEAAPPSAALKTYEGRCFCGAVRLEVTGEPVVAGYCHCESCRVWSASPVNAFTLWKLDTFRVTSGAGRIAHYSQTPRSTRHWCTRCGGHLFNRHPGWGLVDVYAGVIPGFPFRAAVHVNYQETVLPIRDGLPKLKDIPLDMGGTGALLPE